MQTDTMLTATTNNLSLWLSLGLPLGLTLIAQAGALGVAWVTTSRSREAEHQRFLVAERRSVFAEHLAALEILCNVAVEILQSAYVSRGAAPDDFGRLRAASDAYDAAANDALLLGNDEYEQATAEARRAVANIQVAFLRTQARADGMSAELEKPELTTEEILKITSSEALSEITALRRTARRQLHAHR